MSPYPVLHYDATTKQFSLFIEGNKIVVDDAERGFCTLVASYWVFNFCFDTNAQKFLSFVAHYLFRLQNVKLSMPVVRFINFL